MYDLLIYSGIVFMAFFAVVNPIAVIPVFIGLTSDFDKKTVRHIARNSVIIAFIIISVFCLAGKIILSLFGITLSAFLFAGGIVLAIIGYQMLQGKQSLVQIPSSDDSQASLRAKLSIAITPLALPVLAGPGTIATAINYSSHKGFTKTTLTIIVFGLMCILIYILFLTGHKIIAYVGSGFINVITRIMGLIIMTIGIQMFINGLVHLNKIFFKL